MSRKRKLEDPQSSLPTPGGPPYAKKISFNQKQIYKEAVPITDIKVSSFAEHRAIEIQAMTELVKDTGGNHTAFQKLPRHMRRRAMSHNIKRIPRRLHAVAKQELSKTKAPGKRPSRRHRRRPSNLLSEYERRKRKIGWLETHIWHAKRFKMVEKWGYRLALHPNDKSIRACYRAVKHHCLLQDVSFEACIELKGPRQTVLDGLRHLTSSDTGLTFAAKITSNGTRQGHLTLYTMDSYPVKAIGPVTYMWRAQPNDKDPESVSKLNTLWISCHPSIYNDVWNEVQKCFGAQRAEDYNSRSMESTLVLKDEEKVTIKSLKDQLVKFRLFGPASNLILAETLKLADTEISKVSSSERQEVVENPKRKSFWWKNYYSSADMKQRFAKQSELWSKVSKCQSPSEAPPNCILALTVRDPRLLLPPKKNKVKTTNFESVTQALPMDLFDDGIACSPLWESCIREELKATKFSEQELNLMKSKHLVPGTPLELGDMESRIPIVLIQRPGVWNSVASQTNPSHSSGWDLMIPSGFAMAFWVALVYRGARVGGIREAKSICLQAGMLSPPDDYPDSRAGQVELKTECELREAKHNRMPPAKRPNFVKLGFVSPFSFEFEKLTKEWVDKWCCAYDSKCEIKKGIPKDLSVMRNLKMLRLMQSSSKNPKGYCKDRSKDKTFNNNQEQSVLMKILSTEIGRTLISEKLFSLIPVRLCILQRGVPATYGHICLPSQEDLKVLDGDKTFGGPFEPKHKDPGQAARKEERKERLRLRKRKKRGKGKKEKVVESSEDTKEVQLDLEVKLEVSEENQGGKEVDSLLKSTSRDIIGFVKSGDFDLATGQGLGFGFCSVAALLALIENQKHRRFCLALVRNPTSLQYRFATISLLV
ncbi:ribonucleases P/MRP protein subunit POP1-like [Elysia marginata]|uniref:Ribonucleases P/MRP protein subunit POP1-like n=1 Tax=Elysia marginata TaxID=1093978 RepID=A0AAV4FJG8_9GAST|nr:ribonucleases P/MRP protein subunit POP1-like [Elysia marginata]